MVLWVDRTMHKPAQNSSQIVLPSSVWLLRDVPLSFSRRLAAQLPNVGELIASAVASFRINLSLQLRPHPFQVELRGQPFPPKAGLHQWAACAPESPAGQAEALAGLACSG